MADIKFTCPHCHQGIQCDQLWCGHDINCPTCQGALVVPHTDAPAAGSGSGGGGSKGGGASAHNPLVPKPPPGAGSRLSAGVTQVARSSSGAGSPQKPFQRPVEQKKSPWLKYALIVLGLGALGAGGYYGYTLFLAGKESVQATAKAASNRPVGGEIGHTMELYDVLDKTDPNRVGRRSGLAGDINKQVNRRRVPGVPSAGDGAAALAGDDSGGGPGHGGGNSAIDNLPVVAPAYTLDISAATIPVSKVNGVITGSPFVADKARIDKIAGAYALTLRQGSGLTPDRAIRVFLRLKGTDMPTNQTFTVSPDAADPSVMQVSKLWKTGTGFAPTEQKYSSSYTLKLELGSLDKGNISGKIFLALSDAEKTVAAGAFNAALIPEQVTQAPPMGFQRPPPGPGNPTGGRNMRQRMRPGQ